MDSLKESQLMTPERLRQIRHLFESVVELRSTQRDLALRSIGEHDPTILAEVRQLLSAYERRDGFIEKPLVDLQLLASEEEGEPNFRRTAVGPYKLLQLIGQGGMGEVWLAEQTTPVRRRVAVKLIKAGMDTREVVARFESERQALALMCHPAIAKVFDAGSTAEGRPYFAMEYVAGIPITTYCNENNLSLRERLKLFVRVCEGVQHAHQKTIIHRDLKPSNILVTEVDGKPAPKVIDFGVARATSQRLTQETFVTRVGAIIGTPDYMSPEQAASAGEDMDTRVDVYSLGVVLYELLTGVLPFDFRRLAFDEVLRTLREDDAPRPSTRLRALGEQTAKSGKRDTGETIHQRQLRGDLDAITLKALEKDRSRRYGTPSELADDIARYLGSQPVAARPAGASYQMRKYVHRHRVSVAVASLVSLLLAVFGIAEAIQLRRITRERDRANRVAEFMTSMFRLSNPSESRGNSITAREILDHASSEIGRGLAKDADLQAQMMDVMGTVYYGLGLYPQAQALLSRALKIHRDTLGSEHPDTARSMNNLANALHKEGQHAEAEKLYRASLALRERLYGADHPDTLQSMSNLAVALVQEGQYAEAEKLHRNVLDIRRRLLGPEHPDTLNSMDNLGDTLDYEGRYSEGERLEREALEIERRVLGPERPETLRAAHHLANTLYDEGRYSEVEKLDGEVLRTRRRVLGPDHPDTLNAMVALADTLDEEGRYSEAEALEREALEIQRRVPGPDHPDTLRAMSNLARILADEGRCKEAEKLLRELIDIRRRVLGLEHPNTLDSMSKLARVLIWRGRFDEAERLARSTRTLQVRIVGRLHPDTAETTYNLACIAAHGSHPDEALSDLRDAIDHGLRPNAILRMEKDRALSPLHRDARFKALVVMPARTRPLLQLPTRKMLEAENHLSIVAPPRIPVAF